MIISYAMWLEGNNLKQKTSFVSLWEKTLEGEENSFENMHSVDIVPKHKPSYVWATEIFFFKRKLFLEQWLQCKISPIHESSLNINIAANFAKRRMEVGCGRSFEDGGVAALPQLFKLHIRLQLTERRIAAESWVSLRLPPTEQEVNNQIPPFFLWIFSSRTFEGTVRHFLFRHETNVVE